MKRNLFIIGIIVLALMLIGSVLVSAEEITPNTGFNILNWIKYNFNLQSFSVVGTTKQCMQDYVSQRSFAQNEYINIEGEDYCGTELETIFDVFTGTTPYKEYNRDLVGNELKCGNSAGCRVQVYCCNTPCTLGTTVGCDWNGANSICTSASCSLWSGLSYTGYRCTGTYQEPLTGIPYWTSSFKYCSSSVFARCYYYDGSGSTCTKYNDYNGQTTCPTVLYQGLYKLYLSQSECTNNIPTGCTSNEACTIGSCAGTKTCSGGVLGACVKVDANCGGGITNILDTKLEVVDIGVPPAIGENLGLNPAASTLRNFYIFLKNTGTTSETVNIEAGFYTPEYATNVAKLPTNSLFSIWSQGTSVQNCVGSEGFIQTESLTIGPGETKRVSIDQSPLFAYMTKPVGTYVLSATKLVSYIGVYKTCCQKIADFEGCVNGTGGFVKDKNGNPIYKTNWNFASLDTLRPDSSQITCGDGTVHGIVNYKTIGEDTLTISKPYTDCISYKFYELNGTLDIEAINKQFILSSGSTLSGAKKVSLTKEEISIAPTPQLLASSCLSSSECFERTNYSITCNTLASLREEKVLPQAASDSLLDTGKKLANGALTGAGIGAVVCAGTTLYAIFTPEPVTKAVSASIAAFCSFSLTGGAIIGASVSNLFTNSEDKLVQAFKTSDTNSIGICTATESSGWCSFASQLGFIPITKDSCTNGLIFIGALAFLVVILLMRR
jgi:hypothetical protein